MVANQCFARCSRRVEVLTTQLASIQAAALSADVRTGVMRRERNEAIAAMTRAQVRGHAVGGVLLMRCCMSQEAIAASVEREVRIVRRVAAAHVTGCAGDACRMLLGRWP